MTLIELIEHVGLENVNLQPLAQCMTNISTNKRGVSKITFETDGLTATEVGLGNAKRCAFVLWMPVDKLPTPKKHE